MDVAEKLLLSDAVSCALKHARKEKRLKIACIMLSIALILAIGGIVWIGIF